MLLQIITVFCLATSWLVMAEGPQQLDPVKDIKKVTQKDINMDGTVTEQQATATNITDEITELTKKVDALVTLIQPLRGEIMKEVSSFLDRIVENITIAMESWLQPLLNERLPGVTPARPATSCSEIRAHSPSAPTGYYWIQDQDSSDCSIQRYCSMDTHCSNIVRNNTTNTQPMNESPGDSSSYPARSCREIKAVNSSSPSKYYWLVAGNGSSIRVYCEMNWACGGMGGGWMRMADLDMTDGAHTCPQGLRTLTEPRRMCEKATNGQACASVTFDTQGIAYTQVCGNIIGYQYASTNAFQYYNTRETVTIDRYYMDGVVLTHGSNPRQHIWSFAAAVHEYASGYNSQCPCMNEQYTATIDIPPWVRNDYFCDTGAEQRVRSKYYLEDPLWDGEGCGPTSTCCSFNNPPWFSKQLPSPTTDDIEMRLCVDENPQNENLAIEKMELYVQ